MSLRTRPESHGLADRSLPRHPLALPVELPLETLDTEHPRG
jgi:hypothetical protein